MYVLGRYVLLAFFLAVMVDVYAEANPVILQRKLFGVLNKYKNEKLAKNFNKFVHVCVFDVLLFPDFLIILFCRNLKALKMIRKMNKQ